MESGTSSNAPAPFLIKTYEMIDDPLTNQIVSWSQSGCSFVVWNPPDFAQHLLPKYFKHNNFSSFVRQLNTYGFRKIDPDQWEFGNEEFMRGHRHLLSNIKRRKPIHSHSFQNQVNNFLNDSVKKDYEDKIQRLEHEKHLLELQLRRIESEKQEFESRISSYTSRLHNMEQRQFKLVSLVSQVAKKPGFESVLIQQSEYNTKKRRLSESGDKGSPFSLTNFESVDKLDSSIKTLEEFLNEEREKFGQENRHSPSSHPSTPCSVEIPSSPDFSMCVNNSQVESSPKTPEKESELESKNSGVQLGGANDHFWEYFLTEAPGVEGLENRTGERSSDEGVRTSVRKGENNGKGWWSSHVIHDLTMHMEHLAPAGTT